MSFENDKVEIDRKTFETLILSSQEELKRQRRSRWWGFGLKSAMFFGVFGFIWLAGQVQMEDSISNPKKAHIAYVEIYGPMMTGQLADADRLTPAIVKAFHSETSDAVALRINSPGGSPVHAGRLYTEIKKLKEQFPEKPVYAVIEDMGASAAYYVAAAADEIYADKASMVGSIGVITTGFGYNDIMEKVGVERRVLQSGTHKALLDPYLPANASVEAYWQDMLDEVHQQFIGAVKEGRGDRLNLETPDLFEGLMWTGETSIQIGLADHLGSLTDISRDRLGTINMVDYTPAPSLLKALSGQATATVSAIAADAQTPRLW